jgi:hypothetical protein
MGHVFVIDSNGMAIDIEGRRPLDKLLAAWGFAYLHRFWSLKEFEYEMLEWDLVTKLNRNPRAKEWAHKIMDILS